MFALADLAGGEWPERSREAAVGLSASAQGGDAVSSLLVDILEVFLRAGQERVFTRELAWWLNRVEDRPWAGLKRGKEVKPQWVAQQLQVFGIRPRTMRIGEERAKGYERADFIEVCRRYVPRVDLEAWKGELMEELNRGKEEGEPGGGPKAEGGSNINYEV